MKLYFSQQNINTQYLGIDLLLENTPHYDFVKQDGNSKRYIEYLKKSWKYYYPNRSKKRIEEMISEKVKSFRKLIEDIKENGIKEPVVVFTNLDGQVMIFDGNHRASVGLYYNIDIPMETISLREAIRRRTENPNIFYGSKNKGIPYQSIYTPGSILVLEGRRNDIVDRRNMIDIEDITGKTILDMGCNYGNSLLLMGNAKKRIGIDKEADILTSAIRVATIFRQKIDFRRFDLNKIYTRLEKVDTALIFSVNAHLDTLSGLVSIIKNKVRYVVYFETHEGHEIPDEIKCLFSKIELKGKLGSRKFYKCIK